MTRKVKPVRKVNNGLLAMPFKKGGGRKPTPQAKSKRGK